MGHHLIRVIESVGSEVRTLKVGQPVVAAFLIGAQDGASVNARTLPKAATSFCYP